VIRRDLLLHDRLIASAEKRRCPKCQRKAALLADGDGGLYCRWAVRTPPLCDYLGVAEPGRADG